MTAAVFVFPVHISRLKRGGLVKLQLRRVGVGFHSDFIH